MEVLQKQEQEQEQESEEWRIKKDWMLREKN
jgi:hypothetical protein